MSDKYAITLKCETCFDMFSTKSTVRLGYVIAKNGDHSFHGMPDMYWGDVSEKEVVMLRGVFAEMLEVMKAKANDLSSMTYDEMVAVQGVGISMFAQLNGKGVEKGLEKREKARGNKHSR